MADHRQPQGGDMWLIFFRILSQICVLVRMA